MASPVAPGRTPRVHRTCGAAHPRRSRLKGDLCSRFLIPMTGVQSIVPVCALGTTITGVSAGFGYLVGNPTLTLRFRETYDTRVFPCTRGSVASRDMSRLTATTRGSCILGRICTAFTLG